MAKRTEDEDDAYFTDIADREPFRLGHTMKAIEMSPDEEPRDGIIMRVNEGKRKGWVPLADLEVISKNDPNYWPCGNTSSGSPTNELESVDIS
jgi:hypothetical protein